MRLELSPADHEFRAELRDFYRQHVPAGWRSQYSSYEELGAFLRDWERVLYKGGWSVPNWPVEFGGRGATAVQRAIFTEETARFDAPEGINRLGKRLVGPVLMRHGTAEQRAHLEAMRRGEQVWCQGFSEPDAGSDLLNLSTRAVLDGDHYVVNGRKIWTSFAQFADWVLLLVRTGPAGSRERGITILLVRLDTPGIEIRPIKTIAGKSEFNEVTYTDVRVPVTNRVGGENEGWQIVREVLQDERGAEFCLARYSDLRRITTGVVGQARAARADGRPSYVGELGSLYAQVYAVQLAATDLLRREQAGAIPSGLESVVKLYTTETWRRLGTEQVTRWGRDLFDGLGPGQLDDYYESRHYTISAGTSEIQRNLIAGRLLGLPSDRARAVTR